MLNNTFKTIKKNKCSFCKRKTGYNFYECKCNQKFCMKHRYGDSHNCSYDYKKDNRILIKKLNPKIQAANANNYERI